MRDGQLIYSDTEDGWRLDARLYDDGETVELELWLPELSGSNVTITLSISDLRAILAAAEANAAQHRTGETQMSWRSQVPSGGEPIIVSVDGDFIKVDGRVDMFDGQSVGFTATVYLPSVLGMARKAAGNKTRKSVDGPVVVNAFKEASKDDQTS